MNDGTLCMGTSQAPYVNRRRRARFVHIPSGRVPNEHVRPFAEKLARERATEVTNVMVTRAPPVVPCV